MCTSIAFSAPYPLFGRNLDLETPFGQQVVATPRSFAFHFHRRPAMPHHLAMIGMATVAGGVPLYAEAMNEAGLYMAGLNFPGNACYTPADQAAPDAVAPYELIPLVLGSCRTLKEARAMLEGIDLLGIPFAPGYPLAPLHWHIADGTGALVMEVTAEGSRLYEDPVGVLTNNPPFPVQLANLTGYQTLSAAPPENRFAPGVPLPPYGQGMGAIGLPGDCSPMSRFVRAAFLKCNSIHSAGDDAVNQFFRILDAVAMVRGSVMTPEGKPDMTLYSCCADPARGVYYFKTYDNSLIHAVSLLRAPLEASTLCCWPLPGGHGFEALN